jgi:hypothetical protein
MRARHDERNKGEKVGYRKDENGTHSLFHLICGMDLRADMIVHHIRYDCSRFS